jgi:hypothetical protein
LEEEVDEAEEEGGMGEGILPDENWGEGVFLTESCPKGIVGYKKE